MITITQVKVFPVHRGKVLAYAQFDIDGCFRIKDAQILRRSNGYFVSMPRMKMSNGREKQIAFALDPETWNVIEQAVVAEYERVTRTGLRGRVVIKRRARNSLGNSQMNDSRESSSELPRTVERI